jgi:hypothetical protein
VADYEIFMNEEMRRFLKDSGLHVIGYQALKDLI